MVITTYSDLGDTVLLALSNALGIPIIVFSSITNHSIINIMPRDLKTSVPVHLAYLQYGAGHYEQMLQYQFKPVMDLMGTLLHLTLCLRKNLALVHVGKMTKQGALTVNP